MAAGEQLSFGFLLSGTGQEWVDDLRLLIDGKPVAKATGTVFDTNHEFEVGSGIQPRIREGSPVIEQLSLSRLFKQDFIDNSLIAYASFPGFSASPSYDSGMQAN